MAINTALLVASPTLQDVIIDDATGLPLANGQIFLYQDNSRTTFKNWYYQSGAPGNYTYVTLPNPLTLNAAGAISDPNGNDTIPFFYPFSEADNVTPQPYYIQVFNQNGQQKFVRQNFPFNPDVPVPETISTLKNYIVNNGFWRNAGSINTATLTTNPLNGLPSVVIAPGANDGFVMPDIIYSKNANGATETITFTKFANGSFFTPTGANPPNQDVTPEYYLNLNVTAASTETSRYIQIPLQVHVKNLESTQAVFTIWALNGTGNPNNTITINLLQFLGTGVTSPATSTLQTLTLTNAWTKFDIPFTFPSVAAAVGAGQDDAWYIQIAFPAGVGITTNINIAKPSLYIGNVVPNNDFTSYNDVTPIIDGFRTGDIRTSINSFQPFGWVSLNDGTIGSSTSGATTRANADTWLLYNLLWNNVAKPTGNAFAAVTGGLGASAIADFATANKPMALTKALGQSLLGAPITQAVTYNRATTPTWHQADYTGNTGSVAGLFSVTGGNNTLLYPGSPVYLTGTMPASGNFAVNTIYYVIPDPTNNLATGTTFQLASSYANALILNAIAAGGASDNGSNIVVNFALGGNFGQAVHQPQVSELVSHTHTFTGLTNPGGAIIQGGTNWLFNSQNTGATGDSNYFNIIQPGVYYNIFMKL